MTVKDMKCSSCGAQLPIPPPGERFLRCHYCGTSVQLEAPPPPVVSGFGGGPPAATYGQAPPVTPFGAPRIVVVPPTYVASYSGMRVLYMIIPLIIVLFSSGISMFLGSSHGSSSLGGVGSGGVTPLGEHLQWSTDAPVPARVNADDVEDFIGVYHLLEGDQQLTYLGGFNGKTLERVWAAGPFGNLSEANNQTFFSVAGNRAILTDFRSTAHIFDVATGKETGKVTLSDRAKAICTSPDGRAEAWLELSDQQHLLVDLAAGTSKKAPRPGYCATGPNDASNIRCNMGVKKTHAACHEDSSIKAPGVSIAKILSDGDVSVALATKSPGTAIPTALGVDPKSKKVKWQRPIPASDPASVHEGLDLADLGSGRLVAQYQLSSGLWRLAALDGRTGNALWDVEIPRSKDGSQAFDLRITPTRVYLPHWTWLDVFDAKTGTVIGTVGKW